MYRSTQRTDRWAVYRMTNRFSSIPLHIPLTSLTEHRLLLTQFQCHSRTQRTIISLWPPEGGQGRATARWNGLPLRVLNRYAYCLGSPDGASVDYYCRTNAGVAAWAMIEKRMSDNRARMAIKQVTAGARWLSASERTRRISTAAVAAAVGRIVWPDVRSCSVSTSHPLFALCFERKFITIFPPIPVFIWFSVRLA